MNSIEQQTLSYLARRHDGKHYGYDGEQLLQVAQTGEPTVSADEFTDVLASLVARGLTNRTIRWRYYITDAGEHYLSNLTKPTQTFVIRQDRPDAEVNP